MKRSAVILLVILTALVLLAGCGSSGSSVEGVYKVKAGGETVSVITLEAGNKGTISLIEDSAGIPITYEVKDDTVVLIAADGKTEAARLKIVGDGLKDSSTGILYEKE